MLGEEKVALTSAWAGYRWGPVPVHGSELTGAAGARRRSTRGPRPRSRSAWSAPTARGASGDGTEFAGIRPFHAGDRLRRINWRVSLRTGALHVVDAPAARRTAAVLLVVDALADYGRSGRRRRRRRAAST